MIAMLCAGCASAAPDAVSVTISERNVTGDAPTTDIGVTGTWFLHHEHVTILK